LIEIEEDAEDDDDRYGMKQYLSQSNQDVSTENQSADLREQEDEDDEEEFEKDRDESEVGSFYV